METFRSRRMPFKDAMSALMSFRTLRSGGGKSGLFKSFIINNKFTFVIESANFLNLETREFNITVYQIYIIDYENDKHYQLNEIWDELPENFKKEASFHLDWILLPF